MQIRDLALLNTSMNGAKIYWLQFLTSEQETVSVGITIETFVEFRQAFGCDLQLIGRLAIELVRETSREEPIFIEGTLCAELKQALGQYEFRRADLSGCDSISDLNDAINAVKQHLNKKGDSWEYYYTEKYAPTAHLGEFDGSRIMFRQRMQSAVYG
ncbi:MAG: hypothetical protein LZF60_340170 [Nitrospira sp.]|nr:MAG: hypothetical protein LZF60_340170 [Nitrospira sp.]